MADPGDPAAPSGPAGRFGADADRRLGTRLRATHQLSSLSHGSAAPQAGRQPGAPPPSAPRTRNGLSLPAVTGKARRSGKVLTLAGWLIGCGAVVFLWQRPSSAFLAGRLPVSR